MPRREDRREITDVRALRALADPVRLRLLGHLMAVGPRTASQCATQVGATASNCSYHLRELARYGLVERVADGVADGRQRPWQATGTGFAFGRPGETEPALATAGRAVAHAQVDEAARQTHVALERLDALPAEWAAASSFADYELRLSAAELTALTEAVDALIRPYLALTRPAAPDAAEQVHVTLSAYRSDVGR